MTYFANLEPFGVVYQSLAQVSRFILAYLLSHKCQKALTNGQLQLGAQSALNSNKLGHLMPIFNRPGVAGAILQTPPSSIH